MEVRAKPQGAKFGRGRRDIFFLPRFCWVPLPACSAPVLCLQGLCYQVPAVDTEWDKENLVISPKEEGLEVGGSTQHPILL